jgi:hypothetical protein
MSYLPPQLIFFTELEADALGDLLKPHVLDLLAERHYGLAMGMLDFSAERAGIVRMLAERAIPVTAWLLLPKEAGYWLNVENYPQAIAHYRAFRDWSRGEGLTFAAIGLDIEPSLQHVRDLWRLRLLSLMNRIVAARGNALFPAAAEAYRNLSAEIRSDGYAVHTYQYPFVVDDRRSSTTLVQRTLNIVDLPADVEVLMCFSSMAPHLVFGSDLGGALVAEYGLHADSLGIGSTGGGIPVDPSTGESAPCLSWKAFSRDLRLAAGFTDTVHVFSLEGCVWSGYLERLQDLDWSEPAPIPLRFRLTMRLLHAWIVALLWWSRFGLTVLGWLGWVVVAVMFARRAIERWRSSSEA